MDNLIAGVDDATKCPCIGSIFVAGVVADKKTIEDWKKRGVHDSKLVAPKKRIQLVQIIKETARAFSIHEVTPAMIDDKSIFNLNDWEMLIVLKILKDLQNAAPVQQVYVDNWDVSSQLFFQRFTKLVSPAMKDALLKNHIRINRKKVSSLELIPEHHADENHTIVGAASILAKVASENQYAHYKKKYGDFGSGSPGDPATRLFVWNHRNNPPEIIRTSWNTYQTLAALECIEQDPMYAKALKRKVKLQPNSLEGAVLKK